MDTAAPAAVRVSCRMRRYFIERLSDVTISQSYKKERVDMTDKTRWLGLGPWHEDNEDELLDWTVQPQYMGLVKGD